MGRSVENEIKCNIITLAASYQAYTMGINQENIERLTFNNQEEDVK